MRHKYDPKTDILTLVLSRGKPDFGEQKGNVITHYSKSGKAVEIEVLDASKTALEIVNSMVGSKKRLLVVRN